MLTYTKRLTLSEVGTLEQAERDYIENWLRVNFCTQETFDCSLSKQDDGGLLLEDPMENAGGEEAFGVHLLEDSDGRPAFLVLLFENLPEGCIFDRQKQAQVALVIEGSIREAKPGYEGPLAAIVEQVSFLHA